jgi:O-antigen ligase
MVFGWAGWKRAWVYNDAGETISVPDGLWIIAYGQNGVFGLTALTLIILMPQLLFLRRYPPRRWAEPAVGAVAVLPVLLAVFMVDNLLNNMYNPVMLLAAGGLTGMHVQGDIDPERAASDPSSPAPPSPVTPRLL